jgi:hypothetical protein
MNRNYNGILDFQNETNAMFVMMTLVKEKDFVGKQRAQFEPLKPCLYKKR